MRSSLIVVASILFAFATAIFEIFWVTLLLVVIAMTAGMVWAVYMTFPFEGRYGLGHQFRATREGFGARRGFGAMPLTPWSDQQRIRVYGPVGKTLDKYALEIFTGEGFGREVVLGLEFRDVDKAVEYAERMADLIISEGGFDPAASTPDKPLLEIHRDDERDGRSVRIRAWR